MSPVTVNRKGGICHPGALPTAPRSCSVARCAYELQTLKLLLVVTHRSDRWPPLEQPAELQADVRGPRAIAVLRKLAALISADAQAPHFFLHCGFHRVPWSTRTQAPTACLACMVFGRQAHEEALREPAHQAHADGGDIASPYTGRSAPCGRTPRAVCEHELASIAGFVHCA